MSEVTRWTVLLRVEDEEVEQNTWGVEMDLNLKDGRNYYGLLVYNGPENEVPAVFFSKDGLIFINNSGMWGELIGRECIGYEPFIDNSGTEMYIDLC